MNRLRQQLISILCLGTVLFASVVAKPASAQGIPVIDVTALTQMTSQQISDKILDVLKTAALVGVKNAMSAFLGKLAYDAAVYVASAGTGQESLVYDQPIGDYIADAGDAALGGVIEGIATATGLDAAGLCNPGGDFQINLTIGLELNGGPSVYTPACTLTELAGNWKEAYSDPDFSKLVQLQFDSTANPLGISMEAQNLTIVAQTEAEAAAQEERQANNSGFADKVEQISGTILTPGDQIKRQFEEPQNFAQQFAVQSIGNPAVDALSIFTSTLVTKLMQRAQQGLANLANGGELGGLLGGSFSGTTSGRAAAEARYASLRQPVFATSGSFDVLSEMAACPDDPALRTVNNCTIGSAMQTAIQEGWTVQEFVDYQSDNGQSYGFANNDLASSQIQNSEGVNQTGIAVLKKFRVIPVGWQVASDYINNTADAPTLKQLADCYNYCGTADEERSCDFLLSDADGNQTDYSPYCGLVDPYWVLKAPQNFCEREAPGEAIAEVQSFDDDANSDTQEALIVNRLNYCADTRGCIQEDQEGVCTAYGYCTEEERIYRFEGETCDPEYSSCETFTDSDGNDVSYVKSSLNYNDCATDPGCQWYCLSTNPAGDFDCAGPTSTYVSCTEDVTTNESDYGLTGLNFNYNTNEACSCTVTQTCEVPAGSDSGDNNGDGLTDYRQCLVTNTDSSQSICTLSDNCGAGSSGYNETTGTCTCVVTNSSSVDAGNTSVDITVEAQDGSDAIQTCTLEDEDSSGAADSCSADYSTYSNAPVCEISSGNMNCGDICYTSTGGTCTNSLGNTCTDGSDTDSDTTDGECLLLDSCSISTDAYSCTSTSGNTCILGTIAEDPQTVSETIYFDDNVETCSSSDADCTQYIRILPDTNLIPNALFDYYDTDNDTVGDSDTDGVLDAAIDGDSLAFCDYNGAGCSTDANCVEDINDDGDSDDTGEVTGQCVGWIQNGVTAYVLDADFDALVVPDVGTNYIQLDAATSGNTFETTVDTGHALENRTFTFAYRAMTTDSSCSDVSFTIGSEDGTAVSSPVTAAADGTDYEYTDDWQDFTTTYTFADGVTDTNVTVAITPSATCAIAIGAASLVEDDEFSDDYTNYAINNVTYLNGDTLSCEPEDVSCELYVQDGQDDSEGIPGIITNPDSADCVNPDGSYNYGNPSCSQCNGDPEQDQDDDYFAGCDFYQEVGLDHTAPITTDEAWLTAEQREGAMQRSGKYCSGDSTLHCFIDSDCPSGSACIEEVSIVPSSGESCSAASVGCEEYTNLAAVAEGGEGLEYYTELQQCVRTDDQDTAVFYTFEGSDSAGVQVQDHTLKIDQDSSDDRPCLNLDLESEEYNANCVDSDYSASEQLTWDCGPDGDLDGDGSLNTADTTTDDEEYGTDADCRQYAEADGTIFYRYESDVIVASDECTALRNSQDTRVYFALPSGSNSCSAEAVSCREYKGTDSGSEKDVISEDFSSNDTADWSGATSTSNESILQSGYSLQLHDGDTSNTDNATISYALFENEDVDGDGTDETYGSLEDGLSYVLTFWAKSTDGGTLTASFGFSGTSSNDYYFTTDGFSTTTESVTLPSDSDWHEYKLGPVILPEGTNLDEADEYFNIDFTGSTATSEAYFDTVSLTESNSQYLIQDSARSCNNFEGCREYEDRAGNTHYLKSFLRLCGDDVVGCEAMIATQNSSNPFTEAYNLDNEYDEDDVIVQYDQPITLVYNEDNLCSANVMGCTEVGLPDVDSRTGEILDYESTYLLNLPDDYSSTLCEQPQLSCEEYSSGYDGTVYFKDPGERLCELKEYTSDGYTFNGWFKVDSTATEPDCPVQYDYSAQNVQYASQPLGGVCNSNSIKVSTGACTDSSGNTQLIINQGDCEDAGYSWDSSYVDNRVGAICNSDADCYPTGWASNDPRPRCISDIADDIDVNDGGVHQYLNTEDDGVTLTDYTTDFGWVGVCPSDQAGCSEYVDPYSPNISEINNNWSFEDDVRDSESNAYYADDATPDGFPDYWAVPYNATFSGTDYTEVDLDNDGTVDIDSTCDTTKAVISAFASSSINPAEGKSVLELTGPCALEQYSNYYTIEPDVTYTVQAQVKMPKDQMDTGDGSSTASEFSIGVHYYIDDNDGDGYLDQVATDDMTLYPVANHATLEYEDGTDTDGLSYWYRFQGAIGTGTTVPIPTYDSYCSGYSGLGNETAVGCSLGGGTWVVGGVAQYARMFVVNHSSDTVYFDAVSFKEADKYYYVDYTVDGTPEREQQDGTNTCVNQDTEEGEITSDGGCVAFRDMTSDTQNYSQDGLDCSTCLLTPNSDSCRYIADACDTNTVLKVKKDRVCGEWLSCETAQLVEDDNGTVSSQCFVINRCRELDENGNCSELVPDPAYDDLSAGSDLHYNSADGDANALKAIQNLTGYVKVGLTWNDVLYCDSGPNEGIRCSEDSDCQTDTDTTATCSVPFSTEGYYPYGWMTEVGESGSQSGEDLIELNSFENLYCAGALGDATVSCVTNATETTNGNCYTTDLQQKVEAGDMTLSQAVFSGETGDGFTDSSNNASLAFCPNSPNFGNYWMYGAEGGNYKYTVDGWRPVPDGTNDNIFITQYQDYANCEAPCNTIDLNNVLQIGPQAGEDGEAFAGGASYDLQDNISDSGSYSLSFDARYVNTDYVEVGEGDIPSTVRICLQHSNIADSSGEELDRKDCFINGFGMADIVFAVDTSGSMSDEITAVAEAVPDLAEQLASAGIDAKFALVDMDDNDDSTCTDTGVNNFASNYIDLNFTNDIDEFTDAVNRMEANGANVDPLDAIMDVANDSFLGISSSDADCEHDSSLDYRNDAYKFLIVVTDTGDEISNSIGYSDAQDAAVAANLSVFVTTAGTAACANGGGSSATCVDYYEELAAATGGDAYAYDPSGSTSTDWAADTTIVTDLFSNILDIIDVFQFNTELETYTLGPITITERDIDEGAGEQIVNDGIKTKLEFLGSDGTSFQIDNVSLLPVLEVSKDSDPIARSCRAYPETDSLQCSYSETNGTSYLGWKGYCVEADPLNPNRCITWWPIDVLSGETSIVSREASGYSGRASVYSCLISKGLERPGFCNEDTYTNSSDSYDNDFGQGVICTSDAACGAFSGSSCFQGAQYVLDDSTSAGINEHDDLTDQFTETDTTEGGQCEVVDDTDTSCDNWSTSGICSNTDYTTETDCTDAGETWSETFDIMEESDIISDGNCVDIGNGVGFEGNHYNDYSDPQSMTADKYCFYDVDGADGNEVRSTRSCSTDSDCRSTTAGSAYQCATLGCNGSTNNTTCGYHADEDDSQCQSTSAVHDDVPYEVRPLRWQMPDPAEQRAVDAYVDSGGSEEAYIQALYGNGVIVRFPANEIMRNIHASEMEVIEFNPGSAGNGGGAGNEYPFWGQLNGDDDGELGVYDTGETLQDKGGVWLTDLLNGAIEYNDDGSIDQKNCITYHDGDQVGFGCRTWGLYDSDFELENYAERNLPSYTGTYNHGLDLVYTWTWGNFDWGNEHADKECDISGGGDEDTLRIFEKLQNEDINTWSNSDCVNTGFKVLMGDYGNNRSSDSRNIWQDIEENQTDLWDQFYVDDITNEAPDIFPFDASDVSDVSGNIWPNNESIGSIVGTHSGGNILSLYVDFNDEGYIQAVYVLEYFDAQGTEDTPFFGPDAIVETTFQNMMHLDIQTRESCLLVAESVTSTGDNQAWAQRTTTDGYQINYSTSNPIDYDEPSEPFGAITPQDGTPVQWDTMVADAEDYNWNAYQSQPAIAMQTEDFIDAGHPLTCIGDCEQTSCLGDPGRLGNSCSADSCGTNGICMGIGDATISAEGQIAGSSNLQDQIDAVVNTAADRLKHVFANIETFYQLSFTTEPTEVYEQLNAAESGYWNDPVSSDNNMFDEMDACNGDGSARPDDLGGESEYCGVYPTVTGITLNDETGEVGEYLDISNGQTVTLKFTANLDGEQDPLRKIYIDWGDGTSPTISDWDAAPTTHIFTHAYGCGPDNGARFSGTECLFTPKITITDNWYWCSGAEVGYCSTNSAYSNEEACEDNSETWVASGDHRYEPEDSSNVMGSCQSYDQPNLTLRVDASN